MFHSILPKAARIIIVLFLVTAVTYGAVDLLPGDPATAILGETATEEQIATIHEQLNSNDPLPKRYAEWISGAVRGDFGRSLRNHQPVSEALKQTFPVSIELMVVAQLFALAYAIVASLIAAAREGRSTDRAISIMSLGMLSIPQFALGVLLVLVFAVRLKWLPASGWVRPTVSLGDNLRSVILPGLTLAAIEAGVYQRVLRADLTTTLRSGFINFARAKGLTERRVLLRHALRPSSLPLITLMGINIGRMIGGAVVVEVLFALPGVGQLLVQSVAARDIVVVQGIVLVAALGYVLSGVIVDVLYSVLDPRIRNASA